ncbi:hypothetical protein ACTVJH_12170 [Desulfoplanes sp. PS50]|jgi:hypothetical protein
MATVLILPIARSASFILSLPLREAVGHFVLVIAPQKPQRPFADAANGLCGFPSNRQ